MGNILIHYLHELVGTGIIRDRHSHYLHELVGTEIIRDRHSNGPAFIASLVQGPAPWPQKWLT